MFLCHLAPTHRAVVIVSVWFVFICHAPTLRFELRGTGLEDLSEIPLLSAWHPSGIAPESSAYETDIVLLDHGAVATEGYAPSLSPYGRPQSPMTIRSVDSKWGDIGESHTGHGDHNPALSC